MSEAFLVSLVGSRVTTDTESIRRAHSTVLRSRSLIGRQLSDQLHQYLLSKSIPLANKASGACTQFAVHTNTREQAQTFIMGCESFLLRL
jgi:hypothetical protein